MYYADRYLLYKGYDKICVMGGGVGEDWKKRYRGKYFHKGSSVVQGQNTRDFFLFFWTSLLLRLPYTLYHLTYSCRNLNFIEHNKKGISLFYLFSTKYVVFFYSRCNDSLFFRAHYYIRSRIICFCSRFLVDTDNLNRRNLSLRNNTWDE